MSTKENDIIFEQQAEFAEMEHKGGQHKVFSSKCPECYKEKCEDCNGIGEVSTMERVYANEGHYAPVGSETCENCQGSGFELDEQIIKERYA